MNDYWKSIDLMGRTKSVQGISYKWLIQILLSASYLVIPFISIIVKQVSWFKSCLLLRITIEYTNKYYFLIKTKDSIFNRKVYTTDERKAPSAACLGVD
jgi:hypothetical protein